MSRELTDAQIIALPIVENAVESTNVKTIGYRADEKILHVEFLNGNKYRFRNVPEETWLLFSQGRESKGGFFAREIRGKFPVIKINTEISAK